MNEQQCIPAEGERLPAPTKYNPEQAYLYSILQPLLSYLKDPFEAGQYRDLEGALLEYAEAVSAQHIAPLRDPLEVGMVLWLMTRHLIN